jgi:hypothetical protein
MTRSRDVADTQDNLGGAVAPFVAGKNKIINGDFAFWARGTSFTNPSVFQYTADRWQGVFNGTVTGAVTTQQAFTYGTAPVAGYEGTYFMRQVTASQSGSSVQAIAQRIEDVRTFANQTVTFSFWAKADTSRNWTCRFIQSFGTSGSGDVSTANSANFAVTTSWQRFSATFTLPSIAGKTIGAGSYLYAIIDGPINTGQTMDVWGVQVEAGNVATPFTTASGSIGAELALCQRYYYLAASSVGTNISMAAAYTTNTAYGVLPFKVSMRTAPTLEQTTGTNYYNLLGGNTSDPFDSFSSITAASTETVRLDVASGISSIQLGAYWFTINNASARLAFSAEL